MDEEDGRPGPRARQFGPVDVQMDVLVRPLCRSASIPEKVSPFIRISIANDSSRRIPYAIQPTSKPAPTAGLEARRSQVEDTHHENVPGK